MATDRLTQISAQKGGVIPGPILSSGILKAGAVAASVAGCVFLASPAHQALAAPGPFLPKGIQGNPLPLPVGAQMYSKPALADIDADGDIDIFVGDNEGTIHYFENIGAAATPAFELRTGSDSPFWYYESGCDTFYPYSVNGSAAPAFADLDADGDLDALVGDGDGYGYGSLCYFENTGTDSAPAFSPYTGTDFANPFGVYGNGYGATPAFADIDSDGDMDLFIGNEGGSITYFENVGTASAALFTQTDNPLNVNTGDDSAPAFADIDGDGDLDAFVGSKYQSSGVSYGILGPVYAASGGIEYYENVGTAYAPMFSGPLYTSNPFNGVETDKYSAPAFADIDGDGDLDAFVGGKYGSIAFFENTGVVDEPVLTQRHGDGPVWGVDVGKYSKPVFVDIDGDGDMDAFVGEFGIFAGIAVQVDLPAFYGGINFFENIGTAQNPNFVQREGAGNPLDGALGLFEMNSAPAFVDIDGDGDMDAFVGAKYIYGTFITGLEEQPRPVAIQYFKNIGTASTPDLVALPLENPAADIMVGNGYGCFPTFVDIDDDGDFDLFMGAKANNTIYYFENIGTATAPEFDTTLPNGLAEGEENPFGLTYEGRSPVLTFADTDGDGDMDLLVGDKYGNLHYFENTGTATAPAFTELSDTNNPFDAYNENSGTYAAAPAFVDIDGDGDFDLFVGEEYGRIGFLENQEIVPVVPPADDDDDDDDDDDIVIPPADDDSTCFIDSAMGSDAGHQEGLLSRMAGRVYASVCSIFRP